MLTEMSLFDIGVLILCVQKLFLVDKRKSKERARAHCTKSVSVSGCTEQEEAADLKQIILSDGES